MKKSQSYPTPYKVGAVVHPAANKVVPTGKPRRSHRFLCYLHGN
ncbi:MAG TPA: hypothetical protein V6D11_02770 [Waterburya sp.]